MAVQGKLRTSFALVASVAAALATPAYAQTASTEQAPSAQIVNVATELPTDSTERPTVKLSEEVLDAQRTDFEKRFKLTPASVLQDIKVPLRNERGKGTSDDVLEVGAGANSVDAITILLRVNGDAHGDMNSPNYADPDFDLDLSDKWLYEQVKLAAQELIYLGYPVKGIVLADPRKEPIYNDEGEMQARPGEDTVFVFVDAHASIATPEPGKFIRPLLVSGTKKQWQDYLDIKERKAQLEEVENALAKAGTEPDTGLIPDTP